MLITALTAAKSNNLLPPSLVSSPQVSGSFFCVLHDVVYIMYMLVTVNWEIFVANLINVHKNCANRQGHLHESSR